PHIRPHGKNAEGTEVGRRGAPRRTDGTGQGQPVMARSTPLVVWRSGLTGLTPKTPAASTVGVLFIPPGRRTLPQPAPPPRAFGADDADILRPASVQKSAVLDDRQQPARGNRLGPTVLVHEAGASADEALVNFYPPPHLGESRSLRREPDSVEH